VLNNSNHKQFRLDVLQLHAYHSSQPFCAIYPDGKIMTCNQAFAQLTGYSYAKLRDITLPLHLTPPEETSRVMQAITELSRTGQRQRYEQECLHKDGSRIPVEILLDRVCDKQGNIMYYYATVTDISSRKQAEEALKESEQRMADIIDFLPDATFVINLEGKVITWNKAMEEITSVKADNILGKGDYEYSRAFYGTRRPILIDFVLNPDINLEPGYSFIKKEPGMLIAETSVPRINGQKTWLWVKATLLYDSHGKVMGAIETARDITARKQGEIELRQTVNSLQELLEGTVNALSIATEKRDPYTAGHQRRVAQLACAIAQELGFSSKKIKDIRIAAILHDLGKIHLPTDILNKPGSLTDLEMQLIRTHPQIGYEIIETVPFAGPVAQMILQHHERMDGSGYPLGLSGSDIIAGARILGVADVVEAMASHRPYRPALGIDKALEEVTMNRGILYDPMVVDACIRLFQYRRFKFKPA
jgi:PAS domain S-box-containing protein/putative nucleotidyltransferase with HDIG domain